MTVFRQENVDDYYDTGEELGRYQEGVRKRSGWGAVRGKQILLKPGVPPALFRDVRTVEEAVPNPRRPGTRDKLPDPRAGEAVHSAVTAQSVVRIPGQEQTSLCALTHVSLLPSKTMRQTLRLLTATGGAAYV